MGVYENLLPGKENALTPEYLTVKCHFSSVRMLQKQIEAERKDDIKALEDEFEKVETKQREWLDMGFSIDSAPLQELDKQMDDIWADIDRLQRKQKEMQTTGRAYL